MSDASMGIEDRSASPRLSLSVIQRRRRSWLLTFESLPGMTPLRTGLLAAALLFPVSLLAGAPIISPLFVAYGVGITPYLVDRQEKELHKLEPFFERPWTLDLFRERLSRHPAGLLWAGWIVGPAIMLGVNFGSASVTALRSGTLPGPGSLWAMLVAVLYWVIFFQIQVVFFQNAFLFHRLGARHVRVNILDVPRLTPFARVAIRNLLIFVGGFALAPIQLLQGDRYLVPLLISLVITLPCALALVILPVWSVHERLVVAKREELGRIHRALRGDPEALAGSPLREDGRTLDRPSLLLYRDMVERTNEWPIDASAVVRFLGYVVIPLLAWVGAALVERWVNAVF